jgi:hypothetical protein
MHTEEHGRREHCNPDRVRGAETFNYQLGRRQRAHLDTPQRGHYEEQNKCAMVPLPHTIADPVTVMVPAHDAIITLSAVSREPRPSNSADGAKNHGRRPSIGTSHAHPPCIVWVGVTDGRRFRAVTTTTIVLFINGQWRAHHRVPIRCVSSCVHKSLQHISTRQQPRVRPTRPRVQVSC